MADETIAAYRDVYSDEGLFDKLGRFARSAGRELVEKALLLFFVMRDRRTPPWAKVTVVGALGYFIAPIDAIPDLLPGVGFTDDLGVLVAALAAVASSITPEMRAQAAQAAGRLFGEPVTYDDGGTTVIETDAHVVRREPR